VILCLAMLVFAAFLCLTGLCFWVILLGWASVLGWISVLVCVPFLGWTFGWDSSLCFWSGFLGCPLLGVWAGLLG
jgi:hypothetical protein